MKYHTDLDNIKETSKLICLSVPIEPLLGGIIASHPFTNTCNWYNSETGEWLDLTNKDGFNSLPDEFTIYRGVGRKSKRTGISWTRNKEIAEWFMNRWEDEGGYMLMATVKKENCLAYINARDEEEIIVDTRYIKIKE